MPSSIACAPALKDVSNLFGASSSNSPLPTSLQLFPEDPTTQADMSMLNGNFSIKSFRDQFAAESEAIRTRLNAGAVVGDTHMRLYDASTAAVEYALPQELFAHLDICDTPWLTTIRGLSLFLKAGSKIVQGALSRSPDLRSLKTKLETIIVAIDNALAISFPDSPPPSPSPGNGNGGSSGGQDGSGGFTGSSSASGGNPPPPAGQPSGNGNGGSSGQAGFASSTASSFGAFGQSPAGGAFTMFSAPASNPPPSKPLPKTHSLFDNPFSSMNELSTALRDPFFRTQMNSERVKLQKSAKARALMQQSDVPLFYNIIRAVHNSYEERWFDAATLKATSGIWLSAVEDLWDFGNYCSTRADEADYWSKSSCLEGLWGQLDDIDDCMM